MILCPVCETRSESLGPGPGGRPEAACVNCGSLERHRATALLLPPVMAYRPEATLVVEIAPSLHLSNRWRLLVDNWYVAMDLDPSADGRLVDVQASLTSLPLRDRSVGVLLCSHVLEHIPDDAAAMAEMRRVVHPDGVAFIQVPRRKNSPTDEDPNAPVEERSARFGQADHVRYYGDDFEERLVSAGLSVSTLSFADVLSDDVLKTIGGKDEEFWLATVGANGPRLFEADQVLARLIDAMLPRRARIEAPATTIDGLARRRLALIELAAESSDASARADEWESRYRWLTSRLPVRLGLRLKRVARNAARAIFGRHRS